VRSIPLKTLEAPNSPTISYADVLVEVVRRPLNPQQGIQIDEMRKSIRLLDALDAANGTLELEDADYQFLKQKLDNMGWNIADRRIVQLIDDVGNA
jgi:hypothetical protein